MERGGFISGATCVIWNCALHLGPHQGSVGVGREHGWGRSTPQIRLLIQGRHRSDNTVNNRPCHMLVGKR